MALGLVLLLPLARAFDALTLGEETAATLGIRSRDREAHRLPRRVAPRGRGRRDAGIIGFVGLLVPHAMRRVTRSHRALLLLSFLGGAALLVVSDAPRARSSLPRRSRSAP